MKQIIQTSIALALFVGLFATPQYLTAQGSDFSIEKVGKEPCKGLSDDKKIPMTVLPTNWQSIEVPINAGELLTESLTVALVQCGCFRILDRSKRETETDKETMPMAIFQLKPTIMGYQDGKNATKSAGITVVKGTSSLDIVLKIIRLEDREVVFAKSLNGQASKSGLLSEDKKKKKDEDSTSEPTISSAMRAAIEDVALKGMTLILKDKANLEMAAQKK